MHIQNIFIFSLIVCSVQISAQSIDCDEIYKSCTKRAKTVPQIVERENNNCSKEVEKRWIWRNLTQCEIQRLHCQNPGRQFTCDAIAEMANMKRRRLTRCITCEPPRSTRRTTRRTTRRPTRRTTRRTTRRPTRRTTRRTTRHTTRRTTRRTTLRPSTRPTTTTSTTQRTTTRQATRRTPPRITTRRSTRKPSIP